MNKIEGDWCVGLDPSIKDKIVAYFKEFYNHKWQFGGVYYGVKNNTPICDRNYRPTLTKEQFLEKIGETVATKKVTYGAYLKPDGSVMFLNKYESPVPIGTGSGTYVLTNWLSFNAEVPYYHTRSSGSNPPHREMTTEEIQWLEACIKANKFVTKEEALKADIPYKIGDWIVARCNGSTYVLKVTELKNEWRNYIHGTEWYVLGTDKTKRTTGTGGFDTFIRLATADEIPDSEDTNFKVGDWVVFEVNRCVGQYSYCKTSVWNANMVLKVQSVSNTNLHFDGGKSNSKALFRKARNGEILTATAASPWDSKVAEQVIRQVTTETGRFSSGYGAVYGIVQRKNELEHQDPIVISSKRKKTNLITINN